MIVFSPFPSSPEGWLSSSPQLLVEQRDFYAAEKRNRGEKDISLLRRGAHWVPPPKKNIAIIEIQQTRVSAQGTPVSLRHKEAPAEERNTAVSFGRRVEVLDPEDPTLFPEFPPTRPWRGAWE